MEESVFYISEGDPNDKHSQESFALSTSIHNSQLFASFRQCDAPQKGAVLTGLGAGERLFTASRNKALLLVYSWGKESPDQRIPVPEQLSCLTLCKHPNQGFSSANGGSSNLPSFRLPWLLAAGSKSGKVYIWELSSGNLLCVKDAHYQAISVIKFSSCGTFLVTGGEDSRVAIWRTLDLISIYNKSEEANRLASVRPYATFTDHSLAVSDLVISETGILPDIRLYTVSRDSTLRIYDIMTKSLLTTFVLPISIESITKDPANRACYLGLSNGLIRVVPLYQVNPNTSVLESIGGCEKIITLDHDPNLVNTFVHHQQSISTNHASISVTNLAVSMDGTNLVSGDSVGRVFVSDIATKQVVQTLKECNSPISYIQVDTCPVELVDSSTAGLTKVDKHHRLIPPFKRVLASSDPIEHNLYMEIPSAMEQDGSSFEDWLLQKSNQELEYKNNVEKVNSTVKVIGDSKDADRVKELEEKLAKVSKAYTDLRSKHEELYQEHQKML
ncbi:pre-rRNA-processing protein Ipi3p [[Candida] railenensis]|uniref:Pre-rRNA-processing protein IPI3 n=1 Tax=[Candida] railenensis TaxID=45579 RepID=A0A9P0QSY0_9ASCO|nr:pre-rRNA-processing protein Ipi3p [[Candida] railenensis]